MPVDNLPSTPGSVVDIHAHLVPETVFSRLPDGMWLSNPDSEGSAPNGSEPRGSGTVVVQATGRARTSQGVPPVARQLALHRKRQQDRGVDVSVLGPWTRLMAAPTSAKTQQDFCRIVNDDLAAVTGAVTHSCFVAGLPDWSGELAAAELERCVANGAVGGILSANPADGGSLARDDFDQVWATAQRLGVPIVLHPSYYEPPSTLTQTSFANAIGYPLETTVAAAALVARGVPDDFPDLTVVLVHGGGFLPYQYGRIDAGLRRRVWTARAPSRTMLEYVRWFYYDSILFESAPLRYLVDLVGPEHVLAGSDCPFTMSDDNFFLDPQRLGLDAAATARVLGGNARELFGLDGRIAHRSEPETGKPATGEGT